MPELKNKYKTSLIGHQNVKKADALFAFVFSSDIRDWMPKVTEKRKQYREYNALNIRKRTLNKI